MKTKQMKKRTVPETSRAAFLSLDKTKLSELQRRIVYAISVAPLGNATTYEVASLLKEDYHFVQRRFSEIEAKGIIVRTAIKRPLKGKAEGAAYQLAEPVRTDEQQGYIKKMAFPVAKDFQRPAKGTPPGSQQNTLF